MWRVLSTHLIEIKNFVGLQSIIKSDYPNEIDIVALKLEKNRAVAAEVKRQKKKVITPQYQPLFNSVKLQC